MMHYEQHPPQSHFYHHPQQMQQMQHQPPMPLLHEFTNTLFTVYSSPSLFLRATGSQLDIHQRKLNVILPHALKLAEQERKHGAHSLAPNQFWICAWSPPTSSSSSSSTAATTANAPRLEYILSCTEHHLGTYPLFLVHLRPIPSISPKSLSHEMARLASYLSTLLPSTRVFSIYGQELPTRLLCEHWSYVSGHRIVDGPAYYEASSSYVTRETLLAANGGKKMASLPVGHEMRLARKEDMQSVAQLCMEFAADSPPFTLTPARALQESRYMIEHELVYVYTIDRIVTTVVAVTRTSATVAGMTKVYTAPKFRGRGCAEKLVAFVCEQKLFGGTVGKNGTKSSSFESVVLFVGHTLAAARVYHRVGFVGVGPGKKKVKTAMGTEVEVYTPDAENWLELGFEDTEIGHW
ncbi:hypothetical protein FRB91_008124 [Serendipita sp. 411]|nr:hypothetical protein FRC18_007781 [Serendipita sp. 400]KAG8851279.1 hypothetical protein FRB91_008124 [Serendipita sp. 411]